MTAIAPPRPTGDQQTAVAAPTRARVRSAPRYLAPAELALVAVTVAAVLGFNRVFADGAFLGPLLIVAVVAHGLCWAGRRRGLGVPLVGLIAVPVFVLVASWLFFWSTTLPLIPTSTTWGATQQAFSQSWATFQNIVPPAPTETGFVLASCIGIYFAVFLADWAAFRLWSALEAIVPALTLFVFCSLFGAGEQRELATAVFAVAALAFLLLHRTAQRETSAGWLTADVGPGSDAVVRAGALVAVIAVIAGVVVGPYLPGARTSAVIPWKGDGRNPTRTVISPLVNIQDRLLNQSSNEVFTVEAPEAAYWRLTSLEEFTADAWQAHGVYQPANDELATPAAGAVRTELKQTFHITGLGAAWVPAAYLPTHLEDTTEDLRFQADSATLIVKQDESEKDTTSDAMTYTVVSELPEFDPAKLSEVRIDDVPDDLRARYLQLPDDFSTFARDTAARATEGANTLYAKALALQRYFSGENSDFTYNQQVPAGHGESAIDNFLINKEGYCEQFAGSYAAMARSIGLPSRVAVGFTQGVRDPNVPNLWRVTGKFAHAWPEVYFGPEYGWVPFEPTPNRGAPNAQAWTGLDDRQAPETGSPNAPATIAEGTAATSTPLGGGTPTGNNPDRLATGDITPTTTPTVTAEPEQSIIGLSNPAQATATAGLSIVLLALLVAAYAAIIVALRGAARRKRRDRARDASAAVLVAWHECLGHLVLFGLRPTRTETPDEFARRAAPYLDDLADDVIQFAAVVDAASFAPDVLDPAEATRAAQITAAVEARVRERTTARRQWQDRLDPRDLLERV